MRPNTSVDEWRIRERELREATERRRLEKGLDGEPCEPTSSPRRPAPR